jgi:hypothetical protein
MQVGGKPSHSEQLVITDEQRMHVLPERKYPLTHVKHAIDDVHVMHGDTHGGATALLF